MNGKGTLDEQVALLARRLRRAERQQVTLSLAVSYRLCVPLANVRAMVEALDDGLIEDPADVSRYYATILQEIEHLSRMVGDLAALTRIGGDRERVRVARALRPGRRGAAIRSGHQADRPASTSSR